MSSYEPTNPCVFKLHIDTSVIASFNPEGAIRPLYFMYEGEQIKIYDVERQVRETMNTKTCRCSFVQPGTDLLRYVELTFFFRDTHWAITRID